RRSLANSGRSCFAIFKRSLPVYWKESCWKSETGTFTSQRAENSSATEFRPPCFMWKNKKESVKNWQMMHKITRKAGEGTELYFGLVPSRLLKIMEHRGHPFIDRS